MTYQLGPGAGDGASTEKHHARPFSVLLSSFGGGGARAQVPRQGRTRVSEELKGSQGHLSLARTCKTHKPSWGARILIQGKGKGVTSFG